MKKQIQNLCARFTFALLLITLAAPLFVFAQDAKQEDKKKSEEQKKKDKANKAEEIASKQQAKRERRYQKIKVFALDKYQADPSFKDAVDDRYRQVRQDQTREAYIINTRSSRDKLVTKDGEKIQFDNALYDNPLAQDYVNRLGQSLVPGSSKKLFAFKIIQDPVPQARSLSTGTIYISTGYLSIIDNEAQLAYILSHEIAHIEKDHWFEDILVDVGTKPYMEKKEAWTMIVRSLARGAGSLEVMVANVLKAYGIDETFEWETVQEDEADLESMKYMFARNYDVREIPKLYERMKTLTSDPRSQTGFIADPTRIKERLDIFQASSQQFVKADTTVGASDLKEKRDKNLAMTGMRGIARMLSETLAPEIQKKLDAGELVASSEEFQSVMALVKRDNGIRAFQFDMFEMSRDNLEDSIGIRSNDPSAYYYYGKVLKQTARNSTEISKALQNLTQAISLDQRKTIAEPYLFRALLRLGARNPNEAPLIMQDLQTYVSIYQRENSGTLPGNMEFIYDFMQDLGVLDYRVTPAMNTAAAQNSVVGSRPTVGETIVLPKSEQPARSPNPTTPTPSKTRQNVKKP